MLRIIRDAVVFLKELRPLSAPCGEENTDFIANLKLFCCDLLTHIGIQKMIGLCCPFPPTIWEGHTSNVAAIHSNPRVLQHTLKHLTQWFIYTHIP